MIKSVIQGESMDQKIFRTGNSLAVVVPADFIKLLGVKPKDKVKVFAQPEKGRVIYKFSGALQLPLSSDILKKRRRRRISKRKR